MAETVPPTPPRSPNPAPPAGAAGRPTASSLTSALPSLPTPSLGDEWPRQATDAVVNVVDAVRDKTTGPAVNAAHAAKYVIVAAVTGVSLGIVALIALIRGSVALLEVIGTWRDLSWLADPVWIVYLFYGAVFSLIGLLLFRLANRPTKQA